MFMCVVNLEPVNKLDLTWKQSFLILVFLSNPEYVSLLQKLSFTSKLRIRNIYSAGPWCHTKE
jgi:hypothetical protein